MGNDKDRRRSTISLPTEPDQGPKRTGLSCLHPGGPGVAAERGFVDPGRTLLICIWEHCLRNSRTLLQSRDVSESDEARARLLSMHSDESCGHG